MGNREAQEGDGPARTWTLLYERIADELSDDRHGFTPWAVYSWCNPEEAPEQISAWMAKHHPEPEDWTLKQMEKRNPDALLRLKEGAEREARYIAQDPEFMATKEDR